MQETVSRKPAGVNASTQRDCGRMQEIVLSSNTAISSSFIFPRACQVFSKGLWKELMIHFSSTLWHSRGKCLSGTEHVYHF